MINIYAIYNDVLQNIRLVNHYDSVLERTAYLPTTEDSQQNHQRNRSNNRVAANTEPGKDSSYQPTSRLQKTYYSF